ncbi:hypothetical protein KQ693_04815 [Thermus sp. PS18]|uniref:hypothetical protein n=1 Tax=Thermus sp. PS18 TaxID=2849039 RepID=UPI0022648B0A|nr:hypothetical protein [Thermus sp. PS18]UZX16351.1 hypothetical protein KQ693_04815 [Thermus sp. PS18]
MESRALLLALLGFGVAGYLAYQLAKGQGQATAGQTPKQSEAPPAQTPKQSEAPPAQTETPPVVVGDFGGQLPFGLGGLGQDALCRVAPSLCGWYNPAYVGRPAPLPVVPLW